MITIILLLTLARLLEEDTCLLNNYSEQQIQLQWHKEVKNSISPPKDELRALMLMTKWWKRGGKKVKKWGSIITTA